MDHLSTPAWGSIRWTWPSISPGMIQWPLTSIRVVRGGRVKPSALPTDSIRDPRTTTTAFVSGGPPEPSISVAPTRATPSGARETHAASRPSASAASGPNVRESIHGREEVLEGGYAPQAMQAARAPHVYLCR